MAAKSKASKATSKATSFKSVPSAALYPEYEGTDSDALIFPEWSDQELNVEKWEHPKPAAKEKTKDKLSDKAGKEETHKTVVIHRENESAYSNFMHGNNHLFKSSFMRSFVANIGILEYLGSHAPWPMEGLTATYTPTTVGEAWKAWHHVYSACKAGKGQKHKPQVNKLGKYIVRLFWMGTWRRIVIDDFIPIDRNDQILLPLVSPQVPFRTRDGVTEVPKKKGDGTGTESNVVELWPFLVCKALMKIGNLTWTEHKETYDLSMMHQLTGWVCQKLNSFTLDSNEIWDICTTYARHFKWEENQAPSSEKSGRKFKKDDKTEKSEKTGKDKEKSKAKEKPRVAQEDNTPSPFCIIAKIMDTRGLHETESDFCSQLPITWSHLFLINQVRMVPIEKPQFKPVLAQWKRFRWLDWARSHGLHSEEESTLRYLQLVDFFMEEPQESDESLTALSSVPVSVKELQSESVHNSKEVSEERHKKTFAFEDEIPKRKSERIFDSPDDPIFWVDFYQFGKFIDTMYIYFKPQMMHSMVVVTDVQEKRSTQKAAKDTKLPKTADIHLEKRITWPYQIKAHENQPLYLFLDTLDPKVMIFSLSHAGNRAILEQKCLVVHCDLTSLWQKKYVIAERSSMRSHAHLVLEQYDWQTETFGELLVCLNTTGIKTIISSLKAGRQVLRLWIESSSSYILTILSDAVIEVGSKEYILEIMQSESERFLQFCLDIGTAFGNLVQSFGTPQYLECMRRFFSSFQPDASKMEKCILKKRLVDTFTKFIKEKYPDCGEVIFCLRILFLSPSIGLGDCAPRKKKEKKKEKPKVVKVESPPQWDDNECLSDISYKSLSVDEILVEKQRQWAACKLQAFFKMIYVRKLKEYHKDVHPQFTKVFETLKKLYKDFFNVDRRIEVFPCIFRRLLFMPSDQFDNVTKYSWYEDLASVVNNQILLGSIPPLGQGFTSPQWIPILRYVFFVDSPFEENVKISLFSNIEQYVLRVFNNDTLEETIRGVNNACVATYVCNSQGYTILVYGWISEKVTINYKLSLVTLKRSDRFPLNVQDNETGRVSLQDVYHHNKKGLVAKFMVGISNDVSLTFRLGCSYDQVLLNLRCLTKDGKLVQEISGKEVVIMPVLNLEYIKNTRVVESFTTSKKGSKSATSRKSLSATSTQSKRKSNHLTEKVSLTSSLKSKGSRKDIAKKSSSTLDKCYYMLEAQVLKHTWPLTKDEWKESDKLVRRNFVGLGSAAATSPSKSTSLLRRLSDISRTKEYETLPNPKWSLQMIYNPTETVRLNIDQSRAIEMRNKKLKWIEGGSLRLQQGKKLRADFLQELSMMDPLGNYEQDQVTDGSSLFNYSVGDGSLYKYESQVQPEGGSSQRNRTLVHPDSSSRSKQPLDFTMYAYPSTLNDFTMSRGTLTEESSLSYTTNLSGVGFLPATGKCFEDMMDTVDDGVLKKPKDYEQDIHTMLRAIEDFEEYQQAYIGSMTHFREQSLLRSWALQDWYDGVRYESAKLLKKAYRKRAKFVAMLQEKAQEGKDPAGKAKKSDKKSKKGSKSSKGSKGSKGSKASKKGKKK